MNARSYIKAIISILAFSLCLSLIPQVYGSPDEVTKYPTVVDAVGQEWVDEDNMKADDGVCCRPVGQGDANGLECSSFGFDIPSNAILTHIYLGLDAAGYNVYGSAYRPTMYFSIRVIINGGLKTGASIMGSGPPAVDCSDCEQDELNVFSILSYYFSNAELIDLFNDETWDWMRAYYTSSLPIGNYVYYDCVWIRIVYTVEEEREWHNILSWDFNLTTREWLGISTWNFNLSTRQWLDAVSWSFNLTTMQWQNIANWPLNITAMAWHTITAWNFNLISLGWHTIAYWTITLTLKHAISYVLTALFATIILLPLLFMIKKKKEGEIRKCQL